MSGEYIIYIVVLSVFIFFTAPMYYLSADSVFRGKTDIEEAVDMAKKTVETIYN